jgi:transposase
MRGHSITKVLNLPQYRISRILSCSEKEIRVEAVPYKHKPLVCSGCGKVHPSGRHGTIKVVIEDLRITGRRVFLHLVKRRIHCPEDGCIHVEALDWIKPRSRVTNRFANEVYRLTAITTNVEAGWYLGLDDEQVYRIDREKLEELAAQKLMPPPAAKNMSVDEVSWLKYHRYLTIVIDTDIKKVIWNAQGRKKEVLNTYYEQIGPGNCEKVESVALDGARTYISSTMAYAKKALIVYDKFHIIQKLNGAVDTTRRYELRIARGDKRFDLMDMMGYKQRFILLKNKTNLTEKQSDHLKRLCQINEPIYKAMLLKESFQEIYLQNSEAEARRCLETWIEQALTSGLKAFVILAESFRDKMAFILNWFRKKISSAISEGFNNKIKRLKRMAYGYRSAAYFLLKIHQHCGLLNPRIQH